MNLKLNLQELMKTLLTAVTLLIGTFSYGQNVRWQNNPNATPSTEEKNALIKESGAPVLESFRTEEEYVRAKQVWVASNPEIYKKLTEPTPAGSERKKEDVIDPKQ